jgi:monoamine oxidase
VPERDYGVIVVGGGFAGVTAAREAALRGRSVLLLEARDRLGGRTWSSEWLGTPVEFGGQWVHWHQPHTWSELTRAGLTVEVGEPPDEAGWYVGDERRTGTVADRDAIARRGWDRFVDGVEAALPEPHEPLRAIETLARFDRLSIAERLDQIALSDEERAVLEAELESLAHAPLDQAGAASVLRWHALSGYSLALAQFAGGRVTIDGGTRALLEAVAAGADFAQRLEVDVAAVSDRGSDVVVESRAGESFTGRAAIVAVPINALRRIAFSPPLAGACVEAVAGGQASRGIKIFIRARGAPLRAGAIRAGHAFGYLDTDTIFDDGTQLLIGFGPDAARCDVGDRGAVQRQLDAILPGYEVLGATAHDWLADELTGGTWAIHRPGWYERHFAAMRRPHGRVLLAGSDLAAGWAGFIDGAIETGLRAGPAAAAMSS